MEWEEVRCNSRFWSVMDGAILSDVWFSVGVAPSYTWEDVKNDLYDKVSPGDHGL